MGRKRGRPGQFRRPTRIAIDQFDQVYVAESGNSRAQKFDRPGTSPEQFQVPTSIAFDSERNFYVSRAEPTVFSGSALAVSSWAR